MTYAGIVQSAVMAVGVVGLLLLVRIIVKSEPDRVIARLFVLGLLAKLAGSVARYTVMAELYGGRADFRRYWRTGTELAGQIRSGSLPEHAKQTGTAFMEFIAGVVYTVMPHTLWAGFLVFALLSFVGMFLFLQAFRLAVPDGNHRLYAALIFFSPTMVFWPSSMGKEAWLVFTLGVTSYGAARALKRAPFSYLLLALGGAGVFMVRPHMGALIALAFAGSFLLRLRDPDIKKGIVGWVLGLVLVGLGAGYALANFEDELPRDESVEGSPTEQVFAETERRTSQGGSAFDSRPVHSIGDFGHALITVPFRPFATEGHNIQAQVAGLEGTILLLIFLLALPKLAALPRALLRKPYVAMATAYSIGFIIAFSNVGNFGILTRQRAQLLPFLFVILAFRWKRQRDERRPVLLPSTVDRQATIEPHALRPVAAYGNPDDVGRDLEHTRRPAELIVDLPAGVVQEPRPPP